MSAESTSTTLQDHVRVDFSGDCPPEGWSELFERAFKLTAGAGREAVLVDIRNLTGRIPTISERYDIASRVAELQAAYKPRIRLALLGHEPAIHPERFGDIVAARRGAVARAFTEEKIALDWLLGRTSEP